MNEAKILQLIEKHEKEILEIGEAAYAKAIRNPLLKYSVVILEDGSLKCWYQGAGQSNVLQEEITGEAFTLFEFSFENGTNIEISDEIILEALKEEQIPDLQIEIICKEAEEEGVGLERFIKENNPELEKIINACYESEIEADIANYAWDESERKLEETKERLSSMLPKTSHKPPITGRSR